MGMTVEIEVGEISTASAARLGDTSHSADHQSRRITSQNLKGGPNRIIAEYNRVEVDSKLTCQCEVEHLRQQHVDCARRSRRVPSPESAISSSNACTALPGPGRRVVTGAPPP